MVNTQNSETRLYSAQIQTNKDWNNALIRSSRSPKDAELRKKVYTNVFTKLDEVKQGRKLFSGYSEMPILANQYVNATMASYVRSFAGFLSIERNMDQPTMLLAFLDTIGVLENRIVLPNIGQENLDGINARFQTSQTFTVGETSYSISTNKKLIPRTIELNFVHASDPKKVITIKDNGQGNLLSEPGILGANANNTPGVNYTTGLITFTVGNAFQIEPDDSFSIIGYEDIAGSPEFGTLTGGSNNRFKLNLKSINVTAEPDMLVNESDLMTVEYVKKSIGISPQEIIGSRLTELYTKLVNGKLVKAVQNSWNGDTYEIDMAGMGNKYHDFTSSLDFFTAQLIKVDTAMAKRSVKGIKSTAYVVGDNVANWFRQLTSKGFVDNTGSSYVNDLLGYYNGVPVLRHTDIASNDGYAIHKTADGQLAPVIRGIFLPLTNLPLVGNYNNPAQVASGIYYQEANEPIIPELTQKFSVNA